MVKRSSKSIIIYLLPLLFFVFCTDLFPKKKKESIFLVSRLESKNSYISVVVVNGRKYLVKQKKYGKHFAAVRDALSAYIAKDLAIAHSVKIISATKEHPGKVYGHLPATLLTIAPGDTVRSQKGTKYSTLRLKQQWSQAASFQEKGLTRTIINHMTWHEQLSVIVALDLFLGNSDRHCGNLCYDPKTDKFCAIDMDDTFRKDLCDWACKKLKVMLRDLQNPFTVEELQALLIMKNTLNFLIGRHAPDSIVKQLHIFAKEAGFIEGSNIYSDSVTKKLTYYAMIIRQSHASAQQLVKLLDTIT